METKAFFADLLNRYDLGELIDDPVMLPETFLYESCRLSTSSGNYVVKLIEKSVFKEESVLKFLEKESRIYDLFCKAGVCAVYPIAYDGRKLLEIDGRYFYLTEWFDGLPLGIDDVTGFHCEKAAEQLARIHNIDLKETKKTYTPLKIDFDHYAKQCADEKLPISELLYDYLDLIKETLCRGNQAAKSIPSIHSLCHNDYGLKNVLWNNEQFRIIDLEAVDYSNPYQEIVNSALAWSGGDDFCFNEKLFYTYLSTYFKNTRLDSKINWADVYDSNTSRHVWLEHNLKNVLRHGISKEEKETAVFQINKAINRIVYSKKIREKALNLIRC